MRDFLSLALQRQSDRAFDSSRPVEKEKLERILEAAVWHLRHAMPSPGILSW